MSGIFIPILYSTFIFETNIQGKYILPEITAYKIKNYEHVSRIQIIVKKL